MRFGGDCCCGSVRISPHGSLRTPKRSHASCKDAEPLEQTGFTWVTRRQSPLKQFSVSDQQDNSETARLRRVNADLTRSLDRCRALVEDCRHKLAANSNEPMLFDNDDEENDESDLA